MSKELGNIIYKNDTYELRDNSALHQDSVGSWMPDFANLKPISTHEFDIASTSYYKICERPNVAAIKDIADEVLAFRITVTGTNIFSIADVLVRLQPTVNIRPLVVVNYQTQSTSAATTGIRYLRTVNPKAANTSYKYEIAVAAYNATSRHIKVEVFKAPSAWVFSSAATTYSYNSTYQTANDMTLYSNIGVIYNYTFYGTASYANYAGYKSTWDGLFCSGPGNFLKAGAAIATNQFVFIGKDNKFYPTTSTSVEIDPAWPIAYCTTAHAANADVQWSAIRTWGHVSPASSILKDGTLVVDGTVYMRCSYRDGKLYSDNIMTQNLTPDDLANGNAFIKLGKMSSATAVVFNTYNSEYFTLDMDGNIKALNGYLLNAAKADTASTVSKYGSTAAGTYGILFDNNPITSAVPTTTSPRVNASLTFDPSTGNLTSGIFTGSGAGLTGIPSSGINYDELPTIADYTGPSGNGRFVTFLQNESDDPYTHPYLLEAPNAMSYRVGTDSVTFTNGVGLRRYKIGVTCTRYANTNSVSTLWAVVAKTPIKVDPTTHVPTSSVITDNAKMTFRVYGDVAYADGTSEYFDTYFTLCYNGSGDWSAYYETRGDRRYGASITYYEDCVTVAIGHAYNEAAYNKHIQNFKVYRNVDAVIDHLGSTLGYAAGTSDYCKLIENRSDWSLLLWQGNSSESWSDVLSQVYETGRIEGIRSTAPKTDTDVFLSRTASFGENKYKSAKLVGGTVAFNQLIPSSAKSGTVTPNGSYTYSYKQLITNQSLANGHVYLFITDMAYNGTKFPMRAYCQFGTAYGSPAQDFTEAGTKRFSWLIRITTTNAISVSVGISNITTSDKLTSADAWTYDNAMLIDLTLMFGSTIADRIYAMETATAAAGVAWFKKYFPKDYYPYDTGSLVSVCPTGMASSNNMWNNDNYQLLSGSGITKVGTTNLIVDQVAYQGTYNAYPITQTSNPIRLEFDYKVTRSTNSGAKVLVQIYGDSTKSATMLCSYVGNKGHITLVSDNNPTAIKFDGWAYSGTIEITNIFMYEADEQKKDASYKISPLELYGYPSLDSNNNLVYDGDIRESDGTVTRKYAKIELTSFTGAWGATSNGYAVYYANYGLTRSAKSICLRFTYSNQAYSDMPVMTWCGSSGASETFSFILPSTVTSLAEANAWLASNPITFIALTSSEPVESTYPFKSPQLVYSGETESFIDDRDVAMPVGQIAEYMESLDAVEDDALADPSNYELLEKAVYDNAPSVYYGTCSTAATTTTKVIDGVPANAKIQDGTMLHVSFNPVTTTGYSYGATLSINGTNYSVRTYANYVNGYGSSSAYAGVALNQREDVDFVFKTISGVLYAVALDVKAVVLKNMCPQNYRLTNLNELSYPINGLLYTLATGALTAANGKPYFNGEIRDSYVLAMSWDNGRASGAQLALTSGNSTAQGGIAYRRQKGIYNNVTAAGWYDWKTVLDEDNVSKYVSEKTDATFAYTASGLAFSNNALTIPIDGTKYKILQMNVSNKDLTYGIGFPRMFIFDAAGAVGYIENTSSYCTTTSAASGITVAFDSSWPIAASTNVDITVLYRRIS